MKQNSGTAIITLLVFSLFIQWANAQVGRSLPAAEQVFGKRHSGSLDADGQGALNFGKNGLTATLFFHDRVCRRAVYRSDAMDSHMVNRILGLNVSNHDWDVPESDRNGMENEPRHWIRSDSTLRAELSTHVMTVWDTRWQRLAESSPASGVPPTPSLPSQSSQVATIPERKPAPPDHLPAKGDSREKVIEILGPPEGFMRSGGRTILSYPWGHVQLQDNKVADIY